MNIQPVRRTLAEQIRECVDLKATGSATATIEEYSQYITDEANKADADGQKGFVSRRFDLALKYALIHHASVRGAAELFSNLDKKDIDYGILIAEMLGGWKSNTLCKKVVSGDFHRDCEIFKEAIYASVKGGRENPSFSYLATRRVQLKNWMPKYSENIINVLKKRGEIVTKEGQGGTCYFLPKRPIL